MTDQPEPEQRPTPPAQQPTFETPWQPYSEPLPGDTYPAAVLPGVQLSAPPPQYPRTGPVPSQPFPVQAPPVRPRPPRDRVKVLLTAGLVFFVLASGALGTLWLLEQGDRKGTASELQTTKDNLQKTSADLKTAVSDKEAALSAQKRAESQLDIAKPCVAAARGALRAATDDEFKKQLDQMLDNC